MKNITKTAQGGTWLIIFAALLLCAGISTTPASAAVDTFNNNLTLLTSGNSLVGGTNDVHFTWDGTLKTAVVGSGQVSNATLSSPCPFFGFTWSAHDVALYGPGTYTVYSGCPAGSPGCGFITPGYPPITFTVGSGEIGGHILLNWNVSTDVDVVNVWKANSAFGPSPLWTGACGSNSSSQVWDLMSKDINGDGINGIGMVDGPFMDFSANFNLTGASVVRIVDTFNNNLTLTASDGSQIGGTNDVHLTWDGTTKTLVAVSGQVSNATISSPCLFFGKTWAAHDVAIYGPGTYTIYDGCAAGSPGCGSGNPVTFTVGAGLLGGHMLFSWNGVDNMDVVNVWQSGVFAPSGLWTGACGSNAANKVWDLMSTDWNGDGVNGAPMTDGPFTGSNANFNFMEQGIDLCANVVCPAVMVCNSPLVCDPSTGQCVPQNPSCGDGNACTNDSCNLSTGQCVHTLISCDDNNACTIDTCNPATGCVHTPIICNDNNICTNDACSPATGCFYTPINCEDGNPCTIDTCNPTTGCIHTPRSNCTVVVDTLNNNFTLIASDGSQIGGTNDVHFTWDGTTKTSVAVSGQVSNATISSPCPFFGAGRTWGAHDVAIYGPGTYTIYDGCAAGSPGCGSGNMVTFTVGAGQLGGHMLFSWNGNDNMDVVNVWQSGVFAPSGLWTGACGSNPANKVWDFMSTDWNGDGVNGAPMTDGPFTDSDANFNLMATIVNHCQGVICNDRNACTTDTCDAATGKCIFTPKNCDDNNPCTTDSCNPLTGKCVFKAIPKCKK